MKVQPAWPSVPLSDAFWFQEGPGVRNWQFTTSGIKLLNVGNIEKDGILNLSKTDRHLDEGEVKLKYSHFLVDAGDLVIASSGISFDEDGLLRTRGAFVEQRDLPLCLNTSTIRFKAVEGVSDLRFLRLWLDGSEFRSQITKLVTGTAQQNFGPSHLKATKITIPPLIEQQRIATVLGRAEALRAKRRAALVQLDALTQSIFLDIFGSHKQTPVTFGDKLEDHGSGWRWELLTDVARLATGHTPDRQRTDYWNGDTPWITLTEIRQFDGKVAYSTAENITKAGIDNSSAVELPAGTVCFSRTASVGFVTVMGREMATSQDFVNWVCGPRLDPTYLMHAFLQSRARLRALSTGSTHKTIYFPTVEQFRALIPPLPLQREFAQRVAAVEKLKTLHSAALAELDALFAMLQHRAFRGEL